MNVTPQDVQSAATRLEGIALNTPVLSSERLNKRCGLEIFFKCENLQHIGAFKFRGAYNAISLLTADQRNRGVITYSSGNHAQAVARVGALMGIQTVVVMPEDASRTKIQATRDMGAQVVLINPQETTREEKAQELLTEHGYTMIPPFNHPDVIAGQGTAALELHAEIEDLDYLLMPCGGGGLLSGSALATREMNPACKVIGVEPVSADDANRSFRSGEREIAETTATIADGVRTRQLGELTFPLIRELVHDMCTVEEVSIKQALRDLLYDLKILVEPSGVLGLSAILEKSVPLEGKVGVILSGGNVDSHLLRSILEAEEG